MINFLFNLIFQILIFLKNGNILKLKKKKSNINLQFSAEI